MNVAALLVVVQIALALAAPALAQQAHPAGGGGTATAPAAVSSSSALTALVAPRAADLRAAGVQRIVARTGKQRRDIQIVTAYGTKYLAWPKGLTPAPFQLDVGSGANLRVHADGYAEANRERYAAAFDAIIPEAIRFADEAKARVQRPKP